MAEEKKKGFFKGLNETINKKVADNQVASKKKIEEKEAAAAKEERDFVLANSNEGEVSRASKGSKFEYTVITNSGRRIEGEVVAKNKEMAEKLLNNKFAFIISMRQIYKSKIIQKIVDTLNYDAGGDKMKQEDMAEFMFQLGTMINASIEVPVAIASLAKYGEKATKKFAAALSMDILAGKDLAQAFEDNKKYYNGDYSEYIKVGIMGGSIGTVFIELSENIKKSMGVMKKITGAMSYPLMLSGVTVVVTIYLMTSVVPDLAAGIMESFDGTVLPMPTIIVMAISDFLVNNWIYLLIIFLIFAGVAYYCIKYPFKYQWNAMLIKIPVFGLFIVRSQMGCFFRALSISIQAGMSVSQAYMCSARSLTNLKMKDDMVKLGNGILREGKTIANALSDCPYIGGIEVQSIEIGSRASKIDTMCKFCAERLDDKNDKAISQFSSMIEPVMICVIAGVVGFIMAAIYMPQFSAISTL